MRDKSQVFMFGRHKISPSHDFTERILLKVEKLENQRKFISNAVMIVLIFAPFIIRQLWIFRFMHHDYFPVGRMPFGHMIVGAYVLFLSGLVAYILLAAGVLGATIFIYGNRFSLKLRSLTQVFHQVRFRI